MTRIKKVMIEAEELAYTYVFSVFSNFLPISKKIEENNSVNKDEVTIFSNICFLSEENYNYIVNACNYAAKQEKGSPIAKALFFLISKVQLIVERHFDLDMSSEQFQECQLINSFGEENWREKIKISAVGFQNASDLIENLCPAECQFVREDLIRRHQEKLNSKS